MTVTGPVGQVPPVGLHAGPAEGREDRGHDRPAASRRSRSRSPASTGRSTRITRRSRSTSTLRRCRSCSRRRCSCRRPPARSSRTSPARRTRPSPGARRSRRRSPRRDSVAAVVSALPGLRRVEQIMGMPIVVDVRDDVRRRGARRALRLVPRGRRALQHLQGDERDQPPQPRRARGARLPSRRPLGARALRRAARGDGRLLRRPLRVADAASTRPGSSRAGRSTAAASCSRRDGIRNYSINAGGDIRTRGAALPERRWRTGIQHPQQLDRIAAVVEANDLALATSGTYVRGEHIVDPHTGAAAGGAAVGHDRRRRPRHGRRLRDGRVRDGRGRDRGGRRRCAPYEALCILADETSLMTPGFPLAPS